MKPTFDISMNLFVSHFGLLPYPSYQLSCTNFTNIILLSTYTIALFYLLFQSLPLSSKLFLCPKSILYISKCLIMLKNSVKTLSRNENTGTTNILLFRVLCFTKYMWYHHFITASKGKIKKIK